MRFYNIIKDGIENVIDEGQYEAIYKPKGWKICLLYTSPSPRD